jgi:hypothetical protein
MIAINGERLVSSLHKIRDFGRFGDSVVRRSLSQVDLDSREWLVRQLEGAGLAAEIDGVGTVLGRSQRPDRRSCWARILTTCGSREFESIDFVEETRLQSHAPNL